MTEKVVTIKRGGSRFYVHPATEKQVPSVTSIVGQVPKGFLQYWGQNLVAQYAVDNLSTLNGMMGHYVEDGPPSEEDVDLFENYTNRRQAAVDLCKGEPGRYTRARADIGTDAHEYFDRMSQGESISIRAVSPALRPFIKQFDKFLVAVKPTFSMSEEVIWNQTEEYAGTFDCIFSFAAPGTKKRLKVIGDYKTTQSGVHAETALQLCAYANGESIIKPDGKTKKVPKVSGGVVVHVRPEGWSVWPVPLQDDLWVTFKALAQVRKWTSSIKKTAISSSLDYA